MNVPWIRRTLLAMTTANIVLLSACASPPTEADGRRMIDQLIQNSANGLITLVRFAKTNGNQGEVLGVKTYEMDYEADIEFLNDAWWGGPSLNLDGASAFSASPYRGKAFDPGVFMKAQVHKGQRVRVQGSVLFSATEKGWVAEQLGAVKTSQIAGPQAASTGEASANTSLSGRRCAEFTVAHPLPKAPWYDRIRGRSVSIAAGLPDHELPVTPTGGPVGSIAYLNTGEICVGATAVLSVTEVTTSPAEYYVGLSPTSDPNGVRILGLGEVDQGITYAWVVHPDSVRPLSGDLLAGYHESPASSSLKFILTSDEWAAANERGPGKYWSPDGRFLLLRAWTSTSGLLMIDLREKTVRFISLEGLLHGSAERNCWALAMRADSLKWIAPDVMQMPIHYLLESEGGPTTEQACTKPWDTAATVLVDLSRGSASRLR